MLAAPSSRWPVSPRQRGQNLFLERGVEQQHRQLPIGVEQGLDQPPAQRLARSFDQRDHALVDRRGLQQGLENRAQIADRDPLAQQLLQHPAHLAQGQQLGHQFLDQLGMALVERVHAAAWSRRGPAARRACRRISSPRWVVMTVTASTTE